MSHIVIISEDSLFRDALSEAISRELMFEVTAMETAKSLNTLTLPADLVVATVPVPKSYGMRVIVYPAGEPRKMAAMLTEIRSQLTEKQSDMTPIDDTICLQEKSRKLERTDTGTMVELTEKEQSLLLFIKKQGEASREDILKHVWGFADGVTTHTLETHLYRLRQKWRDLADYDCIVATVGGYGWYDPSA